MPALAELLSRSVFYLYANEDSANTGETAGATGFFVSVERDMQTCLYAVTNAHVVDAGLRVLRINKSGGGFGKPLDLSDVRWEMHPTADIAVTEIGVLDTEYEYMAVPESIFCRHDYLSRPDKETIRPYIQIGDDVYMLGRFVFYAGKTRNRPAARSGILSVLPDSNELIPMTEIPHAQEAFLVELRSYAGFSGSPVFWDNPLWNAATVIHDVLKVDYGLPRKPLAYFKVYSGNKNAVLLGINAGSYSLRDKVYYKDQNGDFVPYDDVFVESSAGFAAVIPAWQILEVLSSEVFSGKPDRDATEDGAQKPEGHAHPHLRHRSPPLARTEFEKVLPRTSQKGSGPCEEGEGKT